jgi:molecular chaperone DnaK (HSP70)
MIPEQKDVNDSDNKIKSHDDDDSDSVMDYLEDTVVDQKDKPEQDLDSDKLIIPGIDLGTTNSCISIWRNNNCEIIPDEFGNKTIPSFVSYTNVSKYVGHDAKNQKDINIENVFYEVKRLIGRTYTDKAVQDCKDLLSYNIIENDRGCVSIQSSVRNNKIFTPEEISASVLMKLKDMAQKYLRRDIKDVVITIPAHFNDSQRQGTYDAAKIAGLNCVRMFHEPTAAALAYGMLDRSINRALNTVDGSEDGSVDDSENGSDDADTRADTCEETKDYETGEETKDYETSEENEMDAKMNTKYVKKYTDEDMKGMMILVYDLGGGTLDVSLIDVYDGAFDVQGSSGISHFGGVDFDNRLINYCIAKFSRQFYKQDEKLDTKHMSRVSLQKLRTQCESAKKILSTNAHAVIAIENFHDDKDMFVKISRTDFENLCRDLFLLCIHPIDELLAECGKTENDIDEIILVGGMTRMPYVRELLNNKFRDVNGKARVNCSINPDEAVSIGAAVQGYYIANRDDAFSSAVTLMDVTPLSLGVEVIGGVMDILIKRNTMIPVEVTKRYSTDTDYVDSVLIKIFEGERTMTQHNYKIGEFELDNLPVCQRGVPEIEICFAIDLNGVVTVSAIEEEAKERKSIIVNTNKNGLKPQELQSLIDESIEQEMTDEIERVKKYSYYEIEDLCSNIITNINNKEFKLTRRDIETINDDVTQITIWLKEKPYRERELNEFEDALHKMKKKYGVLILHGKLEDKKVKGNADHMEATTLYGKDDDEEEEEMRQAFEKVKKDEIGGEGMSDSELIEIKDMRDALMYQCKEINNVISSGRMNISRDHKQEILHYIDDVMMWYYSHEKPTKNDYKEKIDYVNTICDEIVEQYEKDGKDLFDKGVLDSDTDTNSQKLEKLCLTLITMIKNKQIRGSMASFALFTNKLQNILKFIYSHGLNLEDSDEGFQDKCQEHINEVNIMCDNIYNNTQGINMRSGPIVYTAKPKTQVVTDNFNIEQRLKGKDSVKPNETNADQQGMSLMELLRMRQNEEIDEMIDKQIIDTEEPVTDLGINDADIMINGSKQDIRHRHQDTRQLFMTV